MPIEEERPSFALEIGKEARRNLLAFPFGFVVCVVLRQKGLADAFSRGDASVLSRK
jgi:hypothetical protein